MMSCSVPKAPYEIAKQIATEGRILGYRSHQVIAFIHAEVEANGQPPSYSMIRDEFDFSSIRKVANVVARLEKRGMLYRSGEGRERRIKLA